MTLDEFGQSVCLLYIQRNEHRNTYQDAKTYLETMDALEIIDAETSDEARARMIETDSIWEIRWYPSTPIGFCTVFAPTFEEAWAQVMQSVGGEAR